MIGCNTKLIYYILYTFLSKCIYKIYYLRTQFFTFYRTIIFSNSIIKFVVNI
nr:MAG TPA: hypothetical protein [Caudoviricetes sp.]